MVERISFSLQETWIQKLCWVTNAMVYVWCGSFKLSVCSSPFLSPHFQPFLALLALCTLGKATTGRGNQQQDNSGLYCEGWAPAPIMPGMRWCHFIFHGTQDISPFNSPSSLFSAFMTLNIYIFYSLPVTLFPAHQKQSYLSLLISHNDTGHVLVYTRVAALELISYIWQPWDQHWIWHHGEKAATIPGRHPPTSTASRHMYWTLIWGSVDWWPLEERLVWERLAFAITWRSTPNSILISIVKLIDEHIE